MLPELSIVLTGAWHLTSQLLEGLPLGLRDQERSTKTAKHEEGEDLHNVVEPWGGSGALWCAAGTERTNDALGDDGTDLARGGGDTVGGRTVAGGEALAGNDEGGGVGAEVEEELSEDVAGEDTLVADLVVTKTHEAEKEGEHRETHDLNRLAADGIN